MLASTAQLVCSLPARRQFRVFLCSALLCVLVWMLNRSRESRNLLVSPVLWDAVSLCTTVILTGHYGRYTEPSLAAYLALSQDHGAGGPATLLSKHNRFSASQLDSSSSCFAYLARGRALCKQRLSHWITEALSLAYSTKGLASPQGIGAHSTRANS